MTNWSLCREPYDTNVTFKITSKQYNDIKNVSEKLNVTISEFIRISVAKNIKKLL